MNINRKYSTGSGSPYCDITELQIEEGNITSPVYEPYNPNTNILLEVGQNVYGGKFIPETGVLTVDRAIVDLGSLAWTYNVSNKIFWGTNTTLISNANANTTPICSCYEGKTPANALNTAGLWQTALQMQTEQLLKDIIPIKS